MQQGQYGRALATVTADVKATGKYAIELKLKQKYAAVEVNLAAPNNFGAIYPKEIAEKFPPAEKATEFIGTGPYKLAEWKPDQHIRMVRFDDYKSRTEKTNGYGGAKTVWVDEIRWIPVPGRRHAGGPDGDWRAGFRRRPQHRRVRPPAEERERSPGGRQAVLLAGRGPQQEGGPDDQPEAAPGLAGGHRHRADHEGGGGRTVRVLSNGRGPRLRREHAVVREDPAVLGVERAQQGEGQEAHAGGRLQRASPSGS